MAARYQIVDMPDSEDSWRWIWLRKRVWFWWWRVDRWPYKPVRAGGRETAIAKAFAAMDAKMRGTEGGNVVHDTRHATTQAPPGEAGALSLEGPG